MIEQNKIILMSKIARYEKEYKRKDKKITDYFVEDYIYVNNFITRVGVSLITLFFIAIGAFKILYQKLIIPESMEQLIEVYIKDYIGPWILMLIIYTFISSLVYATKHRKATRRMNEFKRLLKELEEYENEIASNKGVAHEV